MTVVIVALIVIVVVVVLFFVSLGVRRHGESAVASEDWTPTDEVFVDPGTGRRMRVWVDGAAGRHYVAEQARPGS